MKRLTTTYYDEIYEKLKARTAKKGMKSISDSVREIVDKGLEMEENDGAIYPKEAISRLEKRMVDLQQLLKNNLTWMLETRLLVRHIVQHLPGKSQGDQVKILEQYKEVTASRVKKILEDVL